jgi:phosphoribosylformimino-5-aminoimidazole carboxamide ribotide isomerase
MRIIPVLDVKAGVVVRGMGGRRHEYRPIVSRLTTSAAPLDVARAFRTHFDLSHLYVADLDALAGAGPALADYQALRREGFTLWVDAGVRDAATARVVAACGVEGILVGLETVSGPDELARVCGEFGERVVFSLDLKGGEPLGNRPAWRHADARGVAARAIAAGVRRVLVLDLLRVGEGGGPGTEALCAALIAEYPDLELTAGGGVRGAADLRRLRACGARAALLASALHDGALSRDDVEELRAPFDGR